MRTVLVIDDNPAVAQALSLLFGLHDIRTLAAATPEQGLAAAGTRARRSGHRRHELQRRHHLGRGGRRRCFARCALSSPICR